jgi:hypothetical protein
MFSVYELLCETEKIECNSQFSNSMVFFFFKFNNACRDRICIVSNRLIQNDKFSNAEKFRVMSLFIRETQRAWPYVRAHSALEYSPHASSAHTETQAQRMSAVLELSIAPVYKHRACAYRLKPHTNFQAFVTNF